VSVAGDDVAGVDTSVGEDDVARVDVSVAGDGVVRAVLVFVVFLGVIERPPPAGGFPARTWPAEFDGALTATLLVGLAPVAGL